MSNPNRSRLPLPALINPQGRQCITLYIPDDLDHITAFWGYLWGITRWFNWERDNTQKGKAVASVWEEVWWDGRERWLAGECGDCDDCEGCTTYTTDSRFIEYQPNDPHRTPDLEPPGYTYPPWVVAGDGNVLFEAGTVYTDLSRLPTNFLDIITSLDFAGFPRLKIRFSGTGRVLLHLQQIPLGGLALITVDGNPLSSEFVDLSSLDLLALSDWITFLETLTSEQIEGGLNALNIVEINIENEGDHYIDVTMLPKISSDNILGFGGAFKKVEFCGFSAQEICPDCPEPEPPTPPTIRAGSDCLEWYNPFTNEWECIASYPELGLEKAAAACCECESEECMCNCDGIVRVDPCTNQLQYKKNGQWLPLDANQLGSVGLPTAPDDEIPISDNACFKATGVWKLIDNAMLAFLDSAQGLDMMDAYTYFQNNHPEIDEDNWTLIRALEQWAENTIQDGTVTHWQANKATIKANFICAMLNSFGKTSTLSQGEVDMVKGYQFSTGSNQLNDLLEQVVQIPENKQYMLYAYNAVTAQQGDCDCIEGAPIDRSSAGTDTSSQWTQVFDFKTTGTLQGWTIVDAAGRPGGVITGSGVTHNGTYTDGNGSQYKEARIGKSLPYANSTTRITAIQVFYSATNTGNTDTGSHPSMNISTRNAAGANLQAESGLVPHAATAGNRTFNPDAAQVYVNTDIIRVNEVFGQRNAAGALTGVTGYIEKVVVTGTGKNPFV